MPVEFVLKEFERCTRRVCQYSISKQNILVDCHVYSFLFLTHTNSPVIMHNIYILYITLSAPLDKGGTYRVRPLGLTDLSSPRKIGSNDASRGLLKVIRSTLFALRVSLKTVRHGSFQKWYSSRKK